MTPTQQKILAAIKQIGRPATYDEIAEIIGCLPRTVAHPKYCKPLREQGLIRVAKWKRNLETSGAPTPYFILGDGKKDAPRPKPIPVAERRDRWERKNGTTRKRYLAQGIPALGIPKPSNPFGVIDPLLGALMGGSHAAR